MNKLELKKSFYFLIQFLAAKVYYISSTSLNIEGREGKKKVILILYIYLI